MKFHMPMIAGVDNAAAEKNVQPWVWPYGLKGRQTAVAVSSLHLFKQGRLPKPVLLPQPAVGLVCLLELVLLPDRVQMPVSDKIPSGLVNRKRRSCFPADQIDLLHPLKVTGTGLQAAFPGHGYELEPAGFQPGIQVQFLQKRSRKNQPVLTGDRQEQIEPLSGRCLVFHGNRNGYMRPAAMPVRGKAVTDPVNAFGGNQEAHIRPLPHDVPGFLAPGIRIFQKEIRVEADRHL